MTSNILVHGFAIFLLLIQDIYWVITSRQTEKQIPRQKIRTLRSLGSRVFTLSLRIMAYGQLLGISIFPIYMYPFSLRILGLIIIAVGTGLMLIARYRLGGNWTTGEEYQIKPQQTLTTTGIYSYIRHPIYTGLALVYIGVEVVVGSWLWISYLALFFVMYVQGKREEKILLAHFGEEYRKYMKRTKMLIPFVL